MTDSGFRPDGVDHLLPDHSQPDPPTNAPEGASASVASGARSPEPDTQGSLSRCGQAGQRMRAVIPSPDLM